MGSSLSVRRINSQRGQQGIALSDDSSDGTVVVTAGVGNFPTERLSGFVQRHEVGQAVTVNRRSDSLSTLDQSIRADVVVDGGRLLNLPVASSVSGRTVFQRKRQMQGQLFRGGNDSRCGGIHDDQTHELTLCVSTSRHVCRARRTDGSQRARTP